MIDIILGILHNHILLGGILTWFISQLLKTIFASIRNKTINLSRLFGAGGMPSTHSALVVNLATAIGYHNGWDSPVFAMSVIFAFIVMHDAAGVRRAAGKQAVIVNKLVDDLYHGTKIRQERLKELLGHTPFEVFAGALLGFALAFVF